MFHLRPGKMQGFDKSDIPERLVISDIVEEARQLVEKQGDHKGSMNSSRALPKQVNLEGKDENVNESRLPVTANGNANMINKNVSPEVKKTNTFEEESLKVSTERCDTSAQDHSLTSVCSAKTFVEQTKENMQVHEDDCERTSMECHSSLTSSGLTEDCPDTAFSTDSALGLGEKHCVVRNRSKFTDFEVVFIGTGAALPSKYRNVSATLVNIR